METINHIYNGKSWEVSFTVSDKNSFFHAAFGVRSSEEEPYLDKLSKFRRSRWITFLNYFEDKTMPPRLVDVLKKCLSVTEKYGHVTVEDQEHFEDYILDVMRAKHDVTVEEVSILAALSNMKVVLFKDGESEPTIIIKPDKEILGGYPDAEKSKGEVVLYVEGNVFRRMNPLVEDSLPKSIRNEDKIADAKAAKESTEQSGSGLLRYKKGGSAGSQGVQYQVGLLTVFFINALKQKLSNWRLSTENDAAGKFDDVVMERPEGATLLQAKHKQGKTKKISLEDLISTNSKNDDFSVPKYFLSYEEIRKKFKLNEVIICTNASVDKKAMSYLTDNDLGPRTLLHYENCNCKFYTFNDEIVPLLEENVKTYYANNPRRKGVDESAITEENIKDFLGHLQLFFNYPPENDVGKVTEQLLSQMKLLDNSYVDISPLDIHIKMLEWFQQKDGVYLTELYGKAIISEILRDKHWQKLEKHKILFQSSDLNFQNSQRLFHLIVEGGCLLHEIKVLHILQRNKTKFLFVNPDADVENRKRILEAFDLPQYTILVLVWPKCAQELVIKEASCKLRETLDKFGYKKVVLVADGNNKIPQFIGLSYGIVKESITLGDLSKVSQERLLQMENIIFQGTDISLKQLLADQATEDYAKFLNTEEMEKLIRGEKIKLGAVVPELDEQIREFYIKRKFKIEDKMGKSATREENFSEEMICELNEKAVIISDRAGMGKSTVLTNLAAIMKGKYPHLWVIRIDLINYTQILKHFLRENRKSIKILELLNSKDSTKLTNQLERAVFSMHEKVVLMLDGFDEIAPDYTQLVLSVLSHCQQQQNFANVIVTTRPHMAEELKNMLQVEPFILEPFTEQNQIDFLAGYWVQNLGANDKRDICEEYATTLIEKMPYWIRLFQRETDYFAAVPLHVRMLAEIFQENSQLEVSDDWKGCKEYLETGGVKLNLPENMDVTSLYKMFIKKKQSLFVDKENPSGNTTANRSLKDKFEECLAYYKILALELILDKTKCDLFLCYHRQAPQNLEMYVLKIGIVQKTDNGFHFAHRTLAEYFVAECLIEELQLQHKNMEFQKFLIEEVILTEQNVIHVFLNSFLQQVVDDLFPQCVSYKINSFNAYKLDFLEDIVKNGYVAILQLILECMDLNLFTETLYSDKSIETPIGKTIPKYCNILNIVRDKLLDSDMKDRTFLKHAAKRGHLKMVKFLIEQGAETSDSDTLFHVAVHNGHHEMAKFLVEQGADIKSKNLKDDTTALYKAVLKYDTAMATYLLDRALQCDVFKLTDPIIPYTAAYLGRLYFLKNLIEKGLNANGRVENDETLLFGAIRGGQLETIKYLLQQGCDIHSRDHESNTALHIISSQPSLLPTAKLLVELGVYLNAVNDYILTALHIAAENSNFRLVELLVNHGADITLEDYYGNTVLHIAADNLEGNMVKFLLKHGANINSKNKEGVTALYNVVWFICVNEVRNPRYEILDFIKYFIVSGADVNIKCYRGNTVLHVAAEWGQLDIINLLLEFKADVTIRNNCLKTALHLAATKDYTDIVKVLMENKADSNISDRCGRTVLHSLVYSKSNLGIAFHPKSDRSDVLKLIVQNARDINLKDKDGCTALHLASRCGDLEAVILLVESGVDVDITNQNNQTALHSTPSTDIVKFLMQNKADSNISDKEGQTVLHTLSYTYSRAKGDRKDVFRVVIQNARDINLRDKNGHTALHVAANHDCLDAVIVLVESGVDVDITDKNNRTALHLAARNNYREIVKFLVQNKADSNIIDNDGQTVLHSLVCSEEMLLRYFLRNITGDRNDILRPVIQKAKNINLRDKDGRTALHLAASCGDLNTVILLVESEVDVDITDTNNRTALHLATQKNYTDIIKLLMRNKADSNIEDNDGQTVLPLLLCSKYMSRFNFNFQLKYDRNDALRLFIQNAKDVNLRGRDGCTALHLATNWGDVDAVILLVEFGADVDITDKDGQTALHLGALRGLLADVKDEIIYSYTQLRVNVGKDQVNIVRFLLEQGADVGIRNIDGCTPLHLAAEEDAFDVVVLLVEFGVEVDARDETDSTALHKALSKGNFNIAEYLLQAGADVKIRNNRGYTALHLATVGKDCKLPKDTDSNEGGDTSDTFIEELFNLGIVKTLLARCSEAVDIKDNSGRTALHLASLDGNLEAATLLVEHKADINMKDNRGRSALQVALDYGKLDIAKLLVECGATINNDNSNIQWVISNNNNRTVLHLAAQRGELEIFIFFANLGVDINVTDDEGYTALQLALDGGHLSVVKYLVEKCADIIEIENYEALVLYLAAKSGDLDIMTLFVERCTGVNVTDKDGNTALHSAVSKNTLDAVKFLIEIGIDLNVQNNDGRTALHVAADRDRLSIANFLVEQGADLNVADNQGFTALHIAASCSLDFVTFLVERGADIHLEDSIGDTAAIVAKKKGRIAVFNYLQKELNLRNRLFR